MKILPKTLVRCLGLTLAGLAIHCGGVLDEDHPLLGVYYLESITVKFSPDQALKVEAPTIKGELTVVDTTYEMYYSLTALTGDSRADSVIDEHYFKGPYEFIGADRESLRLHNMPHVQPDTTDWWYHRTTGRLTLDKADLNMVWIYRHS